MTLTVPYKPSIMLLSTLSAIAMAVAGTSASTDISPLFFLSSTAQYVTLHLLTRAN